MTDALPAADDRRPTRWRIAIWSVAAFLLLLPLAAMQVTDEVAWTASDFVFAALLLLGLALPLDLLLRKVRDATYRTAAGLALVAAFLLTWSNLAVGVTDSPADAGYLAVVVVGALGAILARFRPEGMARAMLATALVLVGVSVGAIATGIVPAHNPPAQTLGLTGFFAALFVGSAALFRQAAPRRANSDAPLR